MSYYVYMLLCSDGTFYIGYTNNLVKRLNSHNHLKNGAKYTRVRRPVSIVYKEEFSTLSEALKREFVLKKLTRKEKKELLK